MMRFRRTPWDSKNPIDPSKKPRRALSVRPDLGGAAAGLAAAMRMAGGAIIASIAGLFLADSIHAWPVGFLGSPWSSSVRWKKFGMFIGNDKG